MKKILIVLLLVLMLTGCRKDRDYYCQITGRHTGGYEKWVMVKSYGMNEEGLMELHQKGGYVYKIDLEKMKVLCVEMEELE